MKLQDHDYKSANLLSMQLVQLEDSILKADNRKGLGGRRRTILSSN